MRGDSIDGAGADERHARHADHRRGPNAGAMPNSLTNAIEPQSEQPGISPRDTPAIAATPFQALDSGIVNKAIPTFFIGRNRDGFWVARDAKGGIGGLFLFENSARSFARAHSRATGCATVYQSERFELDLKNSGNPIVGRLALLKHLLVDLQQLLMSRSTRR
jgi:hypothetical protein